MIIMDMLPNVYFDEAGNTGSNITNPSQPYFVLSSVCYSDDELEQLRKAVAFEDELHFVRIKKMWDGREAIRRLLQHPLFDEKHVTYHITDKSFAIYAFMVDLLIEPFFNYCLHEDLYKKRNNIIISNCLYSFAERANHTEVIRGYVNELKVCFEKMMRRQTDECISEFYETLRILHSITSNGFREILEMMLPSQGMLDIVLSADKKYCLDITISSFLVLINHWHRKYGTRIQCYSDNSIQLSAKQSVIEQLKSIEGYQSVGYDTRKMTFPIQLSGMHFLDSSNNYGIQIADLVASIVAFTFTGTKGLEEFQEEMKRSALLHFPCYSLMPASAKDLDKTVDSSNDSDPLDFIVKKTMRN